MLPAGFGEERLEVLGDQLVEPGLLWAVTPVAAGARRPVYLPAMLDCGLAHGAVGAASTVPAPEPGDPPENGVSKYPVPVLRLARLAVDESAKNKGICAGQMLVRAMLLLAARMAGEVGDRPLPLPLFLELDQVPGAG